MDALSYLVRMNVEGCILLEQDIVTKLSAFGPKGTFSSTMATCSMQFIAKETVKIKCLLRVLDLKQTISSYGLSLDQN